jgi:small subunit ribosomal protein S16
MVSIRLSRGGAKKRPFYHIVVTDRRNKRDGRYIERLGFYNPIGDTGPDKLKIDLPRVDYWLGEGAQPSDRVNDLLKGYRKTSSDLSAAASEA